MHVCERQPKSFVANFVEALYAWGDVFGCGKKEIRQKTRWFRTFAGFPVRLKRNFKMRLSSRLQRERQFQWLIEA